MSTTKQLFANNAKTTLLAGIGTLDTSITVSNGTKFPTPAAGQYFLITIETAGIIEVIKVTSRVGNTFGGCLRGQEGTLPSGFPAGARVEIRLTKGTLETLARTVDVMYPVSSIETLNPPIYSDSKSYICASPDDYGNPIVAIRSSDNKWRFSTHSVPLVTGIVGVSPTTTSINSNNIGVLLVAPVSGKYIIQFITGANAGISRLITSSGDSTAGWINATPVNPSPGDQYEIYQSDASILKQGGGGSGSGGSGGGTTAPSNVRIIRATLMNNQAITPSTDTLVTLVPSLVETDLYKWAAGIFTVKRTGKYFIGYNLNISAYSGRAAIATSIIANNAVGNPAIEGNRSISYGNADLSMFTAYNSSGSGAGFAVRNDFLALNLTEGDNVTLRVTVQSSAASPNIQIGDSSIGVNAINFVFLG